MRYKGVDITERDHGSHFELTAEMSRELTDEEVSLLRAVGDSRSRTQCRTLRVTAADRGEAFSKMETKITDLRELGYR
jgi:hypothetical protein